MATLSNSSSPASRQPNRLVHEKSPYLLQHAYNPVDWYPWGEEAFKVARETNKPIFLSIGYSTCHWCHVMERESFEDKDTAAILNTHFVPIKVDREERPDVDRVYMSFVTATTGSGGWPMSVFLTPDLLPFYGGTYFPPKDQFGRPGFKTLLLALSGSWERKEASIRKQGSEIIETLQHHTKRGDPARDSSSALIAKTDDIIRRCYNSFANEFDSNLGGFGDAPKFPRPVIFQFLFTCYDLFRREKKEKEANKALEMACFTLDQMAKGGIYDHLGGGFHRYSVDNFWHVPHFEKMMYDQGQLLSAYSAAFQLTKNPLYEKVVRETITYLLRDMTHPGGAFYSAEDADSVAPNPIDRVQGLSTSTPSYSSTSSSVSISSHQEKGEHAEKHEGAFYVWKEEDIRVALENVGRTEEEIQLFERAYGISRRGNIRRESDPHGELGGMNHLFIKEHPDRIYKSSKEAQKSGAEELKRKVEEMKQQLLDVRKTRPRPGLDDKILTAWNALTISGLIKAAEAFQDVSFYDAAVRATQFILERLYKDKEGILLRSFRGDHASGIEGFLEDYAFFISALLDLFQYDGNSKWLQWAERLQKKQDELFYDNSEKEGGYFTGSRNDTSILLRLKTEEDSAEPSGNSVSCSNLVRLATLTNNSSLLEKAAETAVLYSFFFKRVPHAVPEMLRGMYALHHSIPQVIVIGGREEQGTKALLEKVQQTYLPFKTIIHLVGGEEDRYLVSAHPYLKDYAPIQGKPTVFICKNFSCQLPLNDPQAIPEVLLSV